LIATLHISLVESMALVPTTTTIPYRQTWSGLESLQEALTKWRVNLPIAPSWTPASTLCWICSTIYSNTGMRRTDGAFVGNSRETNVIYFILNNEMSWILAHNSL
jgi:hypothetical protein